MAVCRKATPQHVSQAADAAEAIDFLEYYARAALRYAPTIRMRRKICSRAYHTASSPSRRAVTVGNQSTAAAWAR